MNKTEKANRPTWRPQFGLATFLIGITLVAGTLAGHQVTQRNAKAERMLARFDARVRFESANNPGEKPGLDHVPAWQISILGEDYFHDMFRFDVYSENGSLDSFWSQIKKHQAALSSIEVVAINRLETVDAEIIKQLKLMPLKQVYFDHCEFTKGALEELASFATLESILIENCQQPSDFEFLLVGNSKLTELGFVNCLVDLDMAERMRARSTNTHIFSIRDPDKGYLTHSN